jgi:hypothetical protein
MEASMTPAPTPPIPILTPAYAAGGGIPAAALRAAEDAGWTRHEDKAANVTYVSPDERCRLEFGPETERYLSAFELLWVADFRPGAGQVGAWAASFGDQTPAEAIGAFIATLTDPDGLRETHPGYAAGASAPRRVFEAAQAAGWTQTRTEGVITHTSPDGAAHVDYDTAPPVVPGQFLAEGPHWRFAYRDADGKRDWTAQFTAHTPAEALAAFLAALTDPAGPGPDRA